MSTGNGPSTNGHKPVLIVEDIHTFYGSIEALKGISLEVNEGEIVTLIGANGAGKSTTLRSISGLNPPKTGAIRFRGQDIAGLPGHQVAELGIAPILVERIYETIAEINKQGTTILLVEQNANYALDVSSRGYVLETGRIALTDTSDNLRNDERVQAAYLGA